jgi:hypothetical protein
VASLSGPRGAAVGSGHRDPGGNCRHESESSQQPPVGRAAGAADKMVLTHPPSRRTDRSTGRSIRSHAPLACAAAALDHHSSGGPGHRAGGGGTTSPPTSFHGLTRRRSQKRKRRGGAPTSFSAGCLSGPPVAVGPRLLPRQRGTPQDGGPVSGTIRGAGQAAAAATSRQENGRCRGVVPWWRHQAGRGMEGVCTARDLTAHCSARSGRGRASTGESSVVGSRPPRRRPHVARSPLPVLRSACDMGRGRWGPLLNGGAATRRAHHLCTMHALWSNGPILSWAQICVDVAQFLLRSNSPLAEVDGGWQQVSSISSLSSESMLPEH